MSTRQFAPMLSVLALAGSTDAAKHAAFADVARGVLLFVQHGTRNTLSDTRDALQTLKGPQAKRVLVMVESAYAAADVAFTEGKRRTIDAAQPIADAIVAQCVSAYDAAETAATDARKAKAAESKAKAERAAKIAAKALKDAAKSVEPAAAALTLAKAIEMFSAACAAADDAALSALDTLATAHLEVREIASA